VRSRNILAVTGLMLVLASGATPAVASDVPVSDSAASIIESAPDAYRSTTGPKVRSSSGEAGLSAADVSALALGPYACTLYPSVVHLRKSGAYNTVGAKPYTKCTLGTPSLITHTSKLYKERWLGTNWELMVTKSNSAANVKTLTLKTVAWTCQNGNDSSFMQRTSGTSVEAGHTYYANVSTAETELACGN
jgi:hypothetical protein